MLLSQIPSNLKWIRSTVIASWCQKDILFHCIKVMLSLNIFVAISDQCLHSELSIMLTAQKLKPIPQWYLQNYRILPLFLALGITVSNMQSINVSTTFVAPSANMPLKCALYAFTVMFYFFCELRLYGHKFHPLPSTYSEKSNSVQTKLLFEGLTKENVHPIQDCWCLF